MSLNNDSGHEDCLTSQEIRDRDRQTDMDCPVRYFSLMQEPQDRLKSDNENEKNWLRLTEPHWEANISSAG
jgi:hypothetical protein